MQKLRQGFQMPDFGEEGQGQSEEEGEELIMGKGRAKGKRTAPNEGRKDEVDYFSQTAHVKSRSSASTGSGSERTRVDSSRAGRNTSSDMKTPRARSPVLQSKVLPGSGKRLQSSPQRFGLPSASSSRPPPSFSNSPAGLFRRRSQVNAGDLLTMTGSSTAYRSSILRSNSTLFSPGGFSLGSVRGLPMIASQSSSSPDDGEPGGPNGRKPEFDLKEGVMDCIAKSIGLIQPPLSNIHSVEASPALLPLGSSSAAGGEGYYQSFSSSFSSLSLLQTQARGGGVGGWTGDDASSVTGASAAWNRDRDAAEGPLENEVEILFFKGGDVLVSAGERNAGKRQ